MDKLLNYLEELEAEPSNIGKEQILSEALTHCVEAEDFFLLTFNDTVYGIEQRTFYHAFPCEDASKYPDVSDWLCTLVSEEPTKPVTLNELLEFANKIKDFSGGNQTREIRKFFITLEVKQKKWFCRAILHDLRCGVQVKTYNKVAKPLGFKTVEKFSLQLCGKVDLNDDEDIKKRILFPCYMECKYDGIRLQAEVFSKPDNTRTCRLTSRRGKDRTDKYPEVCKDLITLFPDGYMVLDGEIIAESFQKLTRLDDTSTRRFVVWDILIDEKLPYINRWDNLVNLFDTLELPCITDLNNKEIPYIKENFGSSVILLAEHFTANNKEELREYYDELNKRGEEGIIIKNIHEPYKRNSRATMFKCKKVFTADLRITGWKHGEGKRAGKVSTLCLEDASKRISCDVGSGIDDYWCEKLTADSDSYVGKIAEIKYNEITETGSIRFPRFVTVREDKDEADDLTK